MSKGTTSQDAPFGTLLGYAPGGVAIYSSDYSSLDPQEYEDDAVFRIYLFLYRSISDIRKNQYTIRGYGVGDFLAALPA